MENLVGNLRIGNTDDKFRPLVQKHEGAFKDISSMYQLILNKFNDGAPRSNSGKS